MDKKNYTCTISVSTVGFDAKPPKEMVGKIEWKHEEGVNIDTMTEYIRTGHAFCADYGFENLEKFPTYKHRTKENFRGNSLISIDFDDVKENTLEELINSLKIKPFIAYETFSHRMVGKGNRYRCIYALNKVVTKPKEYKSIVLWLVRENGIEKYDIQSKSAYQVMHGTSANATILQVGNVIDLSMVCIPESIDTDVFCAEPTNEELETLEKWKLHNSEKVDEKTPQLIEDVADVNIPHDVKYVSDAYMLERGYAVDVKGFLWNARKEPLRDGQHRKYRLYKIMKGITQLNPMASLYDLLIWGWWCANQICADKLKRDEVVTVIFNAYHSVRVEKQYDVKKGWGHKKGYGIFPSRRDNTHTMVEEKKRIETLLRDERYWETHAALEDIMGEGWEDNEENRKKVEEDEKESILKNYLGIETNNMVLCTEEEAETVVKGFSFFYIKKNEKVKAKRDMSRYYAKKQKRIKTQGEFEKIMSEYDGKVSTRKVQSYLKQQGFSIENKKLCEFVKCYGILQ